MDTGRFPVISRGDVRAAVLYMAVVVVLYLSGVANQPLLSGVFEATPWPPVVSLVLMLTGALCTLFRSSRPGLLLVVVVPVSLLELLGGHQVSAYILLVEGLWAPVARGNARSAGSATVAGVVVGAVMGVTMVVSWGDTVALGAAVVVGAMIIVVTVFTPPGLGMGGTTPQGGPGGGRRTRPY